MEFIGGIYGSHMLYITFKNLYKSKTEKLYNVHHTLKYFSYDSFWSKSNIIVCFHVPHVNRTSTWTKTRVDL